MRINYDLVLALRGIAPRMAFLSEEYRRNAGATTGWSIRSCETIDRVQDEVVERYDPIMDIIDRLLELAWMSASIHLISSWREEVWDNAQAMPSVRRNEADREELRRQLEASVLRKAKWINPKL